MHLLYKVLLLSTFAVCASANAATITFLDPGSGDNRIDTIYGLEIQGVMYDAMFNYDTSFDGLTDPRITFNTGVGAWAALNSIAVFMNTLGDQTGIVTDDVRVPFRSDSGGVWFAVGVSDSGQNYSDWFDSINGATWTPASFVFTGGNSVDALVTFASSSTSVPEPGSLALLLISGLGVGALHLRRQKSAQQQ